MPAHPVVTVAVPTYRRGSLLRDAMDSIVCQETDFPYEVLVLDNACDPSARATVDEVQSHSAVAVRYVEVPQIGLHNGRNQAAIQSTAEVMIYVDDDIAAQPGWLAAIVRSFESADVHVVGGRYLPAYEETPPAWLDAFWHSREDGLRYCGSLSLLDWDEREREIDPMFVWGLTFAIRRQTLMSLGGFHPDGFPWEYRRFRGDGESAVSQAAKKSGLKAVYQPAAVVYHKVPKSRMTIEYFERRAYLQGISASFTAVRAAGGLGAVESPPSSPPSLRTRCRSWLRGLRGRLRRSRRDQPTRKAPHQEIRDLVSRAYRDGYEFHQDEVRRDPLLLEWVLRKDYWNGDLPNGTTNSAVLTSGT